MNADNKREETMKKTIINIVRYALVSFFSFLFIGSALAAIDENGLTPKHWYRFNGNFNSSGEAAVSISGESDNNFFDGVIDQAMKVVNRYTHPWGNGVQYGNGAWSIVTVAKAVFDGSNSTVFWATGKTGCWFGLLAQPSGTAVVAKGDGSGIRETSLSASVDDIGSYHVYAIVYDGNSTLSLYVDGALVATKTNFEKRTSSDYQWGAVNGGMPSGLARPTGSGIDDWRLYQLALTADQVKAIAKTYATTTSRLVAINFRSFDDQNVGENDDSGVPGIALKGKGWTGWTGKSGTDKTARIFNAGTNEFEEENPLTITYSSATTYFYNSATSPILKGYLDDGNDDAGSVQISATVPFENYDLILICTTDQGSGGSYFSFKVNGEYYYADADGMTCKGDVNTTWGAGNQPTMKLGKNVIRINGLSGDFTLKGNYRHNGGSVRGCVAGLIFVGPESSRSELTATISGEQEWSEIDWIGDKSADVITYKLTLNGETTLIMDEAVDGDMCTILGNNNALTVKNAENLSNMFTMNGVGAKVFEYDCTDSNLTLNDSHKELIKAADTNTKFIFLGDGNNGATLDYGNAVNAILNTHIVFDGGRHSMAWQSGNGSTLFATDATGENPTVLIEGETTLDFSAKDISGWNGGVDISGVIRVKDGGVLNFRQIGTSTMFYRQRLWLDPGALMTFTYTDRNKVAGSGSEFRWHGGAVQNEEQIYVPASEEDATNNPAIILQLGDGGFCLATDPTRDCALFVGKNSKLVFDCDFTEAASNNAKLVKYGEGEFEISAGRTVTADLDAQEGIVSLTNGISFRNFTVSDAIAYRFLEGIGVGTLVPLCTGTLTAPERVENATIYVGEERMYGMTLLFDTTARTVAYDNPTSNSVDENGIVPKHWYKFDGSLDSYGESALKMFGAGTKNYIDSCDGKAFLVNSEGWTIWGEGWSCENGAWTLTLLADVEPDKNNNYGAIWTSGIAYPGDSSYCGLFSAKDGEGVVFAIGDENGVEELLSAQVALYFGQQYHFYTVVYDGVDTLKLYVDGVCADECSCSSNPIESEKFELGSIYGGYRPSDVVRSIGTSFDDLRFYRQALTDEQILKTAVAFGAATYTEKVGDYTWSYIVKDGKAIVQGREDAMSLVGYRECVSPASGDIVVPKELGGFPVVSIGIGAFCGCEDITSIEIPEGVVSVERMAFAGLSLSKLVFPKSLELDSESVCWQGASIDELHFSGNCPVGLEGMLEGIFKFDEETQEYLGASDFLTIYVKPGTTGWDLDGYRIVYEEKYDNDYTNCAIAINFGASKFFLDDDEDSGALEGSIPGRGWLQVTEASTNVWVDAVVYDMEKGAIVDAAPSPQIKWISRNLYSWPSATNKFLKGYLDDGMTDEKEGLGPQINIRNIPFSAYDLTVYTATDTPDRKFLPLIVNGEVYSSRAILGTQYSYVDGYTFVGNTNDIWGASQSQGPVYGTNALRIHGLSGDATISEGLRIPSLAARGGIAAIVITPTEADRPFVRWDGDFDIASKEGCTLSLEGNVVSRDGSHVEIAPNASKGVQIDLGDHKGDWVSALVKYSGFENQHELEGWKTLISAAQTQHGDLEYNDIGICVNSGGFAGFYDSNSQKYGPITYDAPESGYLLFSVDCDGYGSQETGTLTGTRAYIGYKDSAGVWTWSDRIASDVLRFTNHRPTDDRAIASISIGGPKTSTMCPALTGFRIESVELFDRIMTTAQAQTYVDVGTQVVDGMVACVGSNYYPTLAEAIEAANDGDVVKMLADGAGGGIIVDKALTIDFNGYTYTVVKDSAFLFSGENDITLKNGVIDVADDFGETAVIRSDSNLTLRNMVVEGLIEITGGICDVGNERSLSLAIVNGDATTLRLTAADSEIDNGVSLPLAAGSELPKVELIDGAGEAIPSIGELVGNEIKILPVPAMLTLSPMGEAMVENSTSGMKLVLRREGYLGHAMQVAINVDREQINAPESVEIPAKSSSAIVTITPVDNDLIDGNRRLTITATADRANAGSCEVMITDNEVPSLSMAFSAEELSEGGTAISVTISRDLIIDEPLTVYLTGVAASRCTCPSSVVIPAGEESVTFEIVAVDDDVARISAEMTLRASAAGYNSHTKTFLVKDDDVPGVILTLAPEVVSEGAGPQAIYATLTRSDQNQIEKAVRVKLTPSIANQLIMPSEVTIPKYTMAIRFAIGVIDNGLDEGDREVTIDGAIVIESCGCSGQPSNGDVIKAVVGIIDNDGPSLSLAASPATMKEGQNPAGYLILSHNSVVDEDLIVNLWVDEENADELMIPETATIPAGQTSVRIPVHTLDDGVEDGGQLVSVYVEDTAGVFAPASTWVQVSDQNLPDMMVGAVTTSQRSYVALEQFDVTFEVKNVGFAACISGIPYQVHVVKGASNGTTSSSTLVMSGRVDAEIAPDGVVTVPVTLPVPEMPADYRVAIILDSADEINELDDANNVGWSSAFSVSPAYTATVSVDGTSFMPGETVTINGRAMMADGVTTASNVRVEVYVLISGTRRNKIVTTDADGVFSLSFEPSSGEAGHYTVGACYPGVNSSSTMAAFDIMGIKRSSSSDIIWDIALGDDVARTVYIQNRSSIPITGVRATITGVPDECELSYTLAETISGNGSIPLSLIAKAIGLTEQADYRSFSIHIDTDQGLTLDFPAYFHSQSQKAQLRISPTSVNTTMAIGHARYLEFAIVNDGKGDSGKVALSIPATSWLRIVSQSSIDNLASGESATVMLEVSPTDEDNLVLNNPLSDGRLAVNCLNGSGCSASLRFTPVSESTGGVSVDVLDNGTYVLESAPHLANATVKVINPYTGVVVASGITDATGRWTKTGIPEGRYQLTITADKHDSYADELIINPGETSLVSAFVQSQIVSVSWIVEKAEIEDQYEIQQLLEFNTSVPAPIVKTILPTQLPKLSEGESYSFAITFENSGIIAAEEVSISMPEIPGCEFLLADNNIKLPAKSSRTIAAVIKCPIPTRNKLMAVPLTATSGDDQENICWYKTKTTVKSPCGEETVKYSYESVLKYGDCVYASEAMAITLVEAWGWGSGTVDSGGGGAPSRGNWTGGNVGTGNFTSNSGSTYQKKHCDDRVNQFANANDELSDTNQSIRDAAGEAAVDLVKSGVWALVPFSSCIDLVGNTFASKDKEGVLFTSYAARSAWWSAALAVTFDAVGCGLDIFSFGQGGKFFKLATKFGTKVWKKALKYANKGKVPKGELLSTLKSGKELLVHSGSKALSMFKDTLTKDIFKNASDIYDNVSSAVSIGSYILGEYETGNSLWKTITGDVGGEAVKKMMLSAAKSQRPVGLIAPSYSDVQQLAIEDLTAVTVGYAALSAFLDEILDKNDYIPEDTPSDAALVFVESCLGSLANNGVIKSDDVPVDIVDVIGTDAVTAYIESFNHGVEKWLNDSSDDGYVQAGETDVDIDLIIRAISAIGDVEQYAKRRGYEDIFDMWCKVSESINQIVDGREDEICASVTLKLSQTLAMTREAFNGTLTLYNGNGTTPIKDLKMDVSILDEEGNECRELFVMNDLGTSGAMSSGWVIEGGLSVSAGGTGSAVIQFIPSRNAAPTIEKVYRFGGTVTYTDPFSGEKATIKLTPVALTVSPSPYLKLDYFIQRDVYADDPITEQVEASMPAEMAVLVVNTGAGDAKNVTISSVQPEIVKNEKGLDVEFSMKDYSLDATALNGSKAHLGLNVVTLGTIPAGESQVAQWWLTASIQGHFTKMSASVTPVNSWNTPDTVLVNPDVGMHKLIRSLAIEGEKNPYFLTSENSDLYGAPDTIFTPAGDVEVVRNDAGIEVDGLLSGMNSELRITIAPKGTGWNYASVVIPGASRWTVESVTRANGSSVSTRNVWITDRVFRDGLDPLYEDRIHIVDCVESMEPQTYVVSLKAKPTELPEVVRFDAITDGAIENSVRGSLEVVFSKPINPDTFTLLDISLIYQGEHVDDLSCLSVSTESETRFVLSGLSAICNKVGRYELTVQCAGIADLNGNLGASGKAVSWTYSNSATEDPIVIREVGLFGVRFYITFPATSGQTTVTLGDVRLMRNGVDVQLPESASIVKMSNFEYVISGLDVAVAEDGIYSLSVGAGQAAWSVDRTPPLPAAELRISPDEGASASDGITCMRELVVSGCVSEDDLDVVVLCRYVGGDEIKLADAVVRDREFTASVVLPGDGNISLIVRSIDAAGNSSDSTMNIYLDAIPLTCELSGAPMIDVVANEIVLTFDTEIVADDLKMEMFSLTHDGVEIALSAERLLCKNDRVFVVTALESICADDGQYALTFASSDVRKRSSGLRSPLLATIAWQYVKPDCEPPTVSSLMIDGDGVKSEYKFGFNTVEVSFGEPVNIPELIDNGLIDKAVRAEFAYSPEWNAADNKLILHVLDEKLPRGNGAIVLDAALIRDTAGNALISTEWSMEGKGTDRFCDWRQIAKVDSYAMPNWREGTLIVGYKTNAGEGVAEIDGQKLVDGILGNGCQGVSVCYADWDCDGVEELFVGEADGRIVLRRNGEEIEIRHGDERSYGSARAVLCAFDADDDGTRESVVVGGADGRFRRLWRGANDVVECEWLVDENGLPVAVTNGRSSPAFADLNHDGNIDLLAGDTNGNVWLYYGNGGNWSVSPICLFDNSNGLQSDRSRVAYGDVDEDGIGDLIVGRSDGSVVCSSGLITPSPIFEYYIEWRFDVAFDLGEHGTRTGGGELVQSVVYGESAIAPEVESELGWAFGGWDVDFSNVTGDLMVSAKWEPIPLSVGEAVEAVDLIWTTYGDGAWFGEWNANAVSNSNAARSGRIFDAQESVLAVSASGRGVFAFDWKASCQVRYDAVRLEVDGELVRQLSGITDWTHVAIDLGGGDHEIRWIYRKDRSVGEGDDSVWIDNVCWIPADVPTFAEALNYKCDLEWKTGGVSEWEVFFTEAAYEGGSCAVSGEIGDLENSWIETTVSGAGRLEFAWATSCEEGFDWFDFMVDGDAKAILTGETGWRIVQIDLGEGSHTLRWEYWKDGVDDDMFGWGDCVMLDYVRWIPAEEVNEPEFGRVNISEFYEWLRRYRYVEKPITETLEKELKLTVSCMANMLGPKGVVLFDEFVAGTDPTNPDDKFKASITFDDNNKPIVSWSPELKDESGNYLRKYTVYGKSKLNGVDDWVEVKDNAENYNFFKVTVEMP